MFVIFEHLSKYIDTSFCDSIIIIGTVEYFFEFAGVDIKIRDVFKLFGFFIICHTRDCTMKHRLKISVIYFLQVINR